MIRATKGIVLNYIKYKDTSIIVKIYTEKYGLKSFIVNGIRSQKAKKSIGNYQPFTLLDMQIYWHEEKDLLRISESKIYIPTPSISANIKKSTIAIFLSEILLKTLYHETQENNQLYKLIEQTVLNLDNVDAGFEDFHTGFLIALFPLLGFGLSTPDLISTVELDLLTHDYLKQLIDQSIDHRMTTSLTSGDTRKKGLEALVSYMHEHIDSLGEIKSIKVLHQIFH